MTTVARRAPVCTPAEYLHPLSALYVARTASADRSVVSLACFDRPVLAHGFDAIFASFVRAYEERLELHEIAMAICHGVGSWPADRYFDDPVLRGLVDEVLEIREGRVPAIVSVAAKREDSEDEERTDGLILALHTYTYDHDDRPVRGRERAAWSLAFELVGWVAVATEGNAELLRWTLLTAIEWLSTEAAALL